MGINTDYEINSTGSHWTVRWQMFPLKLVTYGQPESVANRLQLNSQNDMDWDEMNLNWLTEELLSQSFPLPVRTNMRAMEFILLTKCLGFRISPAQYK